MILGDSPLGDVPLAALSTDAGAFGFDAVLSAEIKTAPRFAARIVADPRFEADTRTEPES